jgi:integrase/recombinase XerD
MVGALRRMLMILEPPGVGLQSPQADRGAGARKVCCMVPASELLDLGIGLMDACDRAQNAAYKATRYPGRPDHRMLISSPMRLKNLAGLVIGQHLVFDSLDYRMKLTAETKTGRPYVATVPPELTPYVKGWLRVYPLQLIARVDRRASGAGARLWLDRSGKLMTSHVIHGQITLRTRQAFGNAVWPHLFRDCAVTELVDCAPEEIGIAPDRLGHADLQTTRKHYIQAQGMTAHRRIQELIARRRAAAFAVHDGERDGTCSACTGRPSLTTATPRFLDCVLSGLLHAAVDQLLRRRVRAALMLAAQDY